MKHENDDTKGKLCPLKGYISPEGIVFPQFSALRNWDGVVEYETKRRISMSTKTKKLIAALAAVVLVAVMAVVFVLFREKPVEGSKAITLEVVNQAEQSKVYNVKTDAEFLRQAMEEAEGLTFSGTESEYGLMVTEVNGEKADYSVNGAYWSFYVNGDYCNYGIDTQPVEDGDAFRIVYTPAQ